ncbi:Fasciclin domain protein [Gemmata obscuriglobus]|uniref:fasciclin domain-containing protein n=1 Tax=Gemmata obscuriglobus TaxID=114 RepID=UPI0011CD160B|nr:fasciclin domain-containing protein [Gemmata obscuriglobus]QEG27459.1 Fasciclin domain protein [Gemmata obscuriglobus]VTS04437.1 Beta-Ig-H3/fasciclin OS=Calothrix sp. PCC 7507 GN=Cal7507_4626 PE=4 SV=1: Fasciclin [Gemmata obscuriglobus UQM 2246]
MRTGRIAALVVSVILGAQTPPARASDRGTIYDTLAANEQTAILAVAAKETGLTAILKGKDEYTLFAPTDAAFLKLDDDGIGAVARNEQVVQKLLRSHLVKGKHTTAALKKKAQAGESLTTVGGERLKIEERKDGLYVGGVKLEPDAADLGCSNGVIHLLGTLQTVPK